MADPWTANVYSKRATSVSYDPDTEEATVTWVKGGATIYSGVPEEKAIALSKAASVSDMINSDFTGVYPHRNMK